MTFLRKSAENSTLKSSILYLSAAIICIAGWHLFWFITDDAFIAFRYIANSQDGFGYVWNRPPFLPVEGYTGFLWIFLLDIIWTITGFTPPESSNVISLLFSLGTMFLLLRLIKYYTVKYDQSEKTLTYQIIGALILLTNRVFLTWTSSGLETAMFNFFLFLWFTTGLKIDYSSPGKLTLFASAATLSALTRPDGLLFVCATAVVIADYAISSREVPLIKRFIPASPFLLVITHILWRYYTYSEWLPNTYYAKSVSMWPEAGLRYILSFIMEHFLIIWIPLLFFILKKYLSSLSTESISSFIKKRTQLIPLIITGAFTAHVCYYIIFIGGDHFEYRVLSQIIPLISFSFIYFLILSKMRPKLKIALIASYLILSIQIPLIHWSLTHNRATRTETNRMFVPVSPALPTIVQPYSKSFDSMQKWLIEHFICIRHQEHKIFYQYMDSITRNAPLYKYTENIENPVFAAVCVGVIGWKYKDVHIIDLLGLNDYVAARTESKSSVRFMAHERSAPVDYVRAFMPLFAIKGNGQIVKLKRNQPLTDEMVEDIEKRYHSSVAARNN